MKVSVKTNRHYFHPYPFGIYSQKELNWEVTFDESCRYDLQSQDQYDINKLCGIGFFLWHHVNSARFGWNYNLQTKKIDLWAYCYDKKVRSWEHLCQLEIGKEYALKLTIAKDWYSFLVFDGTENIGFETMPKTHNQPFGYKLGTYFGGNRKSPQEMKINLAEI